MADLPFLRGQQVVLRFFSGSSEVVLNAKNFKVTPNVTKIADPVCGEDRDRLDTVVNSFDFTADCYTRDLAILDAWLAKVVVDDAGVAPSAIGAGVRCAPRDGTRKAYVASDVAWDSVDTNVAGRTDRVMQSVTFRSRYYKPAKAA